jgi:predicted amino acid-binding ACT domain protein
MFSIMRQLWIDDCGAVLTAEYLTLGSVVALGSAAGLSNIKQEMNDECREFGKSLREVTRQSRESTLKSMRPQSAGGQQGHSNGQAGCTGDDCTPNNPGYLMMVP